MWQMFKKISLIFVCVMSGLFPGDGGQKQPVLPHVQEESFHLGSTEQQEEHTGQPAAVETDSDLLPHTV